MKKHSVFLLVFFAFTQVFLASPAFSADPDPFQRYFNIHNSLDTAIYPVIQSPQAGANCGTGGLLRIVVNQDKEGAGIPPGGSVSVALPKNRPCEKGGFYGASRIIILTANFTAFEKVINEAQRTKRDSSWDNSPPCPGCWVGSADSAYGLDAPAQLVEYTIISQTRDGKNFDDPNDPNGTSVIDFDLSYVDDVYLPVALGLGDGGTTQTMGSTLSNAIFKQRLTSFYGLAKWSRFASWSETNWATKDECPSADGPPSNPNKTVFSCLVSRVDRLPSANVLIASAMIQAPAPILGSSSYYKASWNEKTPKQCITKYTSDPTANLNCPTPPPIGSGVTDPNQLCCPQPDGVMGGCCDQSNFLIDNTSQTFNTHLTPVAFQSDNPTLDDMVKRFKQWQGAGQNPCADATIVGSSPVVDKQGFCTAFKNTVDFLWKEFTPQCPGRGEGADRCIVAAIIGYTVQPLPADCIKCPNSDEKICPRDCSLDQMRNESTQAIQRDLPWVAYGHAKECGACPSSDPNKCPTQCIFTEKVSPDAKLYMNDKFLHFWADYANAYNLNPYARFVHNKSTGLDAPGAYSFSIDDFYGNFGGPASSLNIDVGGNSNMQNKELYDPYKQYFAGLGKGWHHASVCGRRHSSPAGLVGWNAPFAFWSDGKPISECELRLFPTADETQYIAYMLKEHTYNVVDQYTGKTHSVQGLGGVYTSRFNEPIPDDPYCMANSKYDSNVINTKGLCRGNLAAGGNNKTYVGVSNEACKGKGNDPTCGRPLVSMNAPAIIN